MTSERWRRRFRRAPLAAALALLFSGTHDLHAQQTLPVPCAGACGAADLAFVTHGQASYAVHGTSATITQTTARAILNWQSFNIGAGNSVVFDQQAGASAVALNRIHDANPTDIAGRLSANGQVYLINANGVVFRNGAQVDTAGLIASTLNVTDAMFQDGALFSQTTLTPAFVGSGGAVVVETGALLRAAEGGKVMLFAPTVENRGRIEAPGGQIVLAAGQKVYLRGSNDDNLRGLVVEVDSGGTATNAATGTVVAARGNVTVAGLAVNQAGRVRATTTVSRNGSIHLLARDTVTQPDASDIQSTVATRTGTVSFASGSVTEIVPEIADAGTIDQSAALKRSQVIAMGRAISVAGDIVAPAGDVTLQAVLNPSAISPSAARNESRVTIAGTGRIDVSGLRDVALDLSKSTLKVELRGDELKDSPVQRDGFLRGKTVVVDVARGTRLADVSRQIAAIQRGIGEKSAEAGTVTIHSEGDVVIRSGAVLDVSGGSWRYSDGYVNTTRVVVGGRILDIADAPAEGVVEGFANSLSVVDGRWGQGGTLAPAGRFVSGYVEGRSAGTIRITSNAMAIDGTLHGDVVAGPNQRTADTRPPGGQLVLSDFKDAGNGGGTARLHDLVLAAASSPWVGGDDVSLPAERATTLNLRSLTAAGFSRFDFTRNGSVTFLAPVTVAAGGSLGVLARDITVASDIRLPGGRLTLEARSILNERLGAVTVAPGTTLSVRGEWVNDFLPAGSGAPTRSAFLDAGAITLRSAGELRLGSRDGTTVQAAVLDAVGGGWIDPSGRILAGRGGDVTLVAGGDVLLAAKMLGHSLTNPGVLHLDAPAVTLRNGSLKDGAWSGADLPGTSTLVVPTAALTDLGFGDVELVATVGDLRVAAGTQVHPRVALLATHARTRLAPSGADILDASVTTSASFEWIRPAANLTLSHRSGSRDASLVVEAGASITTDIGGALSLSSRSMMVVAGTLDAPAGTIDLTMGVSNGLGFVDSQAIWLGPAARVSAAGAFLAAPSRSGLQAGAVRDAGTIRIVAERGFVVTERGSVIDVSGRAAALDVYLGRQSGYERRTFTASAGTIRISAAEGALLDGALLGAPAPGVSGAAGGRLELATTLINRQDADPALGFPATSSRLTVVAAAGPLVPASLKAGDPILRSVALDLDGQFLVSASTLAAGAFDTVRASSDRTIAFTGDVRLAQRLSLALEAPRIDLGGGDVTLVAPFVAIGSPDRLAQDAGPGSFATVGRLTVAAGTIDLVGNIGFHGAAALRLESRGDIRLTGVTDVDNRLVGSVNFAQPATLVSAQIYPTTLSNTAILAPGQTLRLERQGQPGIALSAGGTLRIEAAAIEQAGVLRAPSGRLVLSVPDACGRITLEAGSVTSTAAEGTVPVGHVQNGREWVYETAPGFLTVLNAPPEKRVVLQGADVVLAPGAKVDVSGGGTLIAAEFVPGPGGSVDRLAPATAGGAFAILPEAAVSSLAPHDPEYSQAAGIGPTRLIELGTGSGVPAGRYVVLPARYAVLPGARLVTPVEGSAGAIPGQSRALADGAAVVAGRFRMAGTDIVDAQWQAFAVRNQDAVARLMEIRTYQADAFFRDRAVTAGTDIPRLGADAGGLSIVAGRSLDLSGTLVATPVIGARGATVDIASSALEIIADDGAAQAGAVAVKASVLNALGAESLLLGGVRTETARGTYLSFKSNTLVLAGDALHPERAPGLTAPEVILAARARLSIGEGGAVRARGGSTPGSIHIGQALTDANGDGVYSAAEGNVDVTGDGLVTAADGYTGDGAVIRVSSAAAGALVRTAVTRANGDIQVAGGVVLGGRTIAVDATRDHVFRGTLDIVEGGGVSLGASRIVLGGRDPASDGLTVTDAQLPGLSRVDRLTLRSYSTIDFRDGVSLGRLDAHGDLLRTDAVRLRSLVLDAGVLRSVASAPDSRSVVAADAIRIVNTQGANSGETASGGATSTLRLVTDELTLSSGTKSVRGFGDVRFDVAGDVRFDGVGSTEVAAPLTVAAARLMTLAGARQGLAAEDTTGDAVSAHALSLHAAIRAATGSESDAGLAGHIVFRGASVDVSTRIAAPAGRIEVRATGASGSATLRDGTVISVAGGTSVFDDQGVHVDAGQITLASDAGAVAIDAGARLDASATGNARAGTIALFAPSGLVSVRGVLDATHADGAGGRFALDARGIDGSADPLVRILRDGGFDAAIDLRLRAGDLVLGDGDAATLRAHDVRVAVDAGALTLRGAVSSDGSGGGRVGLYAGGDVVLDASARITARATLAGSEGGTVELGSRSGVVRLAAGAAVDVTGTGGRVNLRVLANAQRNGVNVDIAGGATITGASRFTVEGVQVFDAASITPTLMTTVMNAARGLMDNRGTIEAALRGASLVPGIEIVSSGSLRLASDWNLGTARPGDEAGHLTLRAAGDLVLAGSLSDGFTTATAAGALQSGAATWSYRLVAGADSSAANPLAVAGAGGDVVINAGKLVRTGTGSIDVTAARDIDLGRDTDGINKSTAALYTAGRAGGTLAEFTAPGASNYPVEGGDISLQAGRDIRGAVTHQLAGEWLLRQGQMTADGLLIASRNPSWWIDFSRFQQNLGTLGGGDVRVNAGGDVVNLSVVLPTTGRLAGMPGTAPDASNLVVTGGGDLAMSAGGSVLGGMVYVARGQGTITAGDRVAAGAHKVGDTNPGSLLANRELAPVFALGESTLAVRAGLGVDVGAVVNPTVIAQDSRVLPTNALTNPRTYFFTYGASSGFAVRSLTGDVRLLNDLNAIEAAVAKVGTRAGIVFRTGISADRDALAIYPADLRAEALGGAIRVENKLTLYPSPEGDLVLRAATDVAMRRDALVTAFVAQSDTDPALLNTALYVPSSGTTAANRQVTYAATRDRLAAENVGRARLIHASTPIHLRDGDSGEPVRIVARDGDIGGTWYLAKPAGLAAGGDIRDILFDGQNLRAGDVTSLVARGAIAFGTNRNAGTGVQENNPGRIVVSGPGLLAVRAGGDIDLGNAQGIVTRGNVQNPFLDPRGADISLQAGASGNADLDAFASAYLDPAGASPTSRAEHGAALTAWVQRSTGVAPDTPEDAYARFTTLPVAVRRAFLERVFFLELKRAGEGVASLGRDAYDRGYRAIETLFGPDGVQRGNLSLLFSQIKTESGGDIHLFVPGGQVNAGQTTPPSESGSTKDASQLGIIAQDVGAVRAFVRGAPAAGALPAVRGDFAVNESRVFTLRGGDILIWSSDGDIDAGRGAKTAVSAPPPILVTDANGNTVFKFQSVSGSGIRSILTDTSIVPGDVDLIAPRGTVDAGDAGIGAAGRITIAAQFVKGADNIAGVGGITGVAVDNSASLGASLASVAGTSSSDASRSTDRATQSMAGSAQAVAGTRGLPSFINVEVIGFGPAR